ncbi:MAG: gamma carbonic anhydrase family protein [Saprospiraceae bacterium]|nr:gamma carbonic anhydrase family protein [Saprospiraceae bacterium]
MALILPVRDKTPRWGESCFFAENATLVGDVMLGEACSVWFQAVIRGDVHEIRIGNQVNIQDGVIIHCTYEKAGTYIGDRVSIGHRAIVHGCKIASDVLIGMGAIVMDHCEIPSNVLVAAGAVVLENSVLESGYIYAGVPAKKVKALDQDVFNFHISRTAKNYEMYASWFKH